METTDFSRLLMQMREAQVTIRRTAIVKNDIAGLRQAQADIETIDRAKEDEISLAKVQIAAAEAVRFASQSPSKHKSAYEPYSDEELGNYPTL